MSVSEVFIPDVLGEKNCFILGLQHEWHILNSHSIGTETALKYRSIIAISSPFQKKLQPTHKDFPSYRQGKKYHNPKISDRWGTTNVGLFTFTLIVRKKAVQ